MKKVICPFDFSHAAHNAALYAGQMAAKLEAQVYLIYIIDNPTLGLSGEKYMQLLGEDRGYIDHKMHNIARDLERKYSVEFIPVIISSENDIREEIKYFTEADSMIIMGIEWQTTIWEIFKESNGYKLLKMIDKPVLMVPERSYFIELKKIVLATKFHEEDIEILQWLANLPSPFDPEIHVIHVSYKFRNKNNKKLIEHKLDIEKINGPYNNFFFHHEKGEDIAGKIIEWGNTNGAQLYAVTTELSGRTPNSIVLKLTRMANKPVLFIPKRNADEYVPDQKGTTGRVYSVKY